MKAVTAFRNLLKRRGEILWTKVSYCLDAPGDELEIRIRFKIKLKKRYDKKEVDVFREARAEAEKTYEERLLSRTDNGDELR